MRSQTGLAIVFTLALVCIPRIAPAGCPAMGVVNVTCSTNSSSIETCVNKIWSDLRNTSFIAKSLKSHPGDPAARMALLGRAKDGLLPAIQRLGDANDYTFKNFSRSCDAPYYGIDICEGALRTARHGQELLMKPGLVATLSPATLERLKKTLRQHEAQYTAQLDSLAASGQGDPSQLCNETYAPVGGCERAVAADRSALREQIFPEFSCGRVIPGKFLTAKDAAAEAQRGADHPELRIFQNDLTFEQAAGFFQNRLRGETEILEKLKQTR
jgi:hypothetical protein